MILVGLLALAAAALFTGAAVYISVAEQPARLALPPEFALREWKPAYHRGLVMQVALVAIGTLAGALVAAQERDLKWLAGAALLFANLPFTLGVLMKTNAALEATSPQAADDGTMALLKKWGELHLVRCGLGAGSVAGFLWAVT